MAIHGEFEDLMIRSALGEITETEFASLNAHLKQCTDCRRSLSQFQALTRNDLPLIHEEYAGPIIENRNERDLRTRFVKAAEEKGFHFAETLSDTPGPGLLHRLALHQMLGVVVLIICAMAVTGVIVHNLEKRASNNSAEIFLLEQQLVQTRAEGTRYRLEVERGRAAQQDSYVESQNLRQQIGALRQQIAALQAQVQSENRHGAILLTASKQKDFALAAAEKKVSELQSTVAQTKADNKVLTEAHRSDQVLSAFQERKLDELAHELQTKEALIGQTKTMMTADRDIRDLMGARQLHIVDVFDADPAGKRQRRFGRVFYTEGKSLVFYAFDLTAPGVVNAKESFQAWGTKYGTSDQAVNLGMFYMDDKSQRRWALKVNDPDLLSEIDSVFVTAEPSRDGKKPTGRRLLFAFLKNPANHP